MHQEYAINPECICGSYDRFVRFWDACGFPNGRLIAKFPSKWKRFVFCSESFKSLTPLNQQRVEVLLSNERGRLIAAHRSYNKEARSWQEAAVGAHQTKSFQAIIDEEDAGLGSAVAAFDDINEEHPLWSVKTNRSIKRSATAIGESAKHLLAASRNIKFIDPYFSLRREFTEPFWEFFSHIASSQTQVEEVEVHFKYSLHSRNLQWDDFVTQFERELQSKRRFYLPDDAGSLVDKLVFHAWEDGEDETFHARCIVTELGGLNYDNGLDLGKTEGDETLVFMLNDELAAEYRTKFSKEHSPFNHKGEFRAADLI